MLETAQVARELMTDLEKGLSEEQYRAGQIKFGPNELKERRGRGIIMMLLDQFKEFIVLILIAACIISMFLGEMMDAMVILAIVVLNAALGVVQEERANKAIAALKRMSTPKVMVKRDGELKKVSQKDLVPGDIIFLETGGYVGADARIIESINLKINESSLTGESTPVDKTSEAIHAEGLPVADMNNMVFMGTFASYGRGEAVVVATGMDTQIGKIAEIVQEEPEVRTPLQNRLEAFGKWLGLATLFICLIVFITAIIEGGDFFEDFLTAVSLAVAAIPEGLPAVTTISLALGAYRMSKKGAIIRKLPAVETLGSVSVICSDKTGTLTQNKMSANVVYVGGRTINITGVGYDPKGDFYDGSAKLEPLKNNELKNLLTGMALCNDSYLERLKETGAYDVIGDPTEGALIVLAAKAGITRLTLESDLPRVNELPFDSRRKLMSTVHRTSEGKYIVYTKGAPEQLLELCSNADKQQILAENVKLTSQGLRTLGLAYKETQNDMKIDDMEKGLVFIGLVAMIDQARPEVKDAVRLCKEAGITPVMITGDHKLTADAIARELGIEKVYARVSPEQKLNIVEEYKSKGHIVAVTGDGVNDAPALKRADIGIAMGITGTDVAKEASDMVLADDNFATIVEAVREGRGIFENIRKFVWYLLSANVGEILTMFFAIILRMPLPLLPIQILWVNLVTDGLPALALSAEPIESDVMKAPPRKKEEGIINKSIIISMFMVGISMAVVTLILFNIGLKDSLLKGRTFAFSALAMLEMYHVFNCKSEKLSVFKTGIFSNIYLILSVALTIILQLLVIYNPVLQKIFRTVPLSGAELMLLFALSSTPLILIEIKKAFERSFAAR
jgi:Ca2+-transporting ATPase